MKRTQESPQYTHPAQLLRLVLKELVHMLEGVPLLSNHSYATVTVFIPSTKINVLITVGVWLEATLHLINQLSELTTDNNTTHTT